MEDEQIDPVGLDLGEPHWSTPPWADVIATLGQAVSQLVGIGRVDQLDREAALGVETLRLRRELRQVGQGRKHDDLERGLRPRRAGSLP